MTAAVTKAPALPIPAWSSLILPLLGGYGYWFMRKHEEVKKMQEMAKELGETREGRDAAIATATQVFKLVEHFVAIEKLLCNKLKAAEDALKKEREESMEAHHKDFEVRRNLEKANEDWKRKHADLEAKCAQLEVKLKEKKGSRR